MNKKELTKTFMMISNWNKPFGLHDYTKLIQRRKGSALAFLRFILLDIAFI